MHVQSVQAKQLSRWRERGSQLRCLPRHLTEVQNDECTEEIARKKLKKALSSKVGQVQKYPGSMSYTKEKAMTINEEENKRSKSFLGIGLETGRPVYYKLQSGIDEENKKKEQTLREFELQKIRLQNETQRVVGPQTIPQTKIELKKLLPTFNPEVDNMDLFLTLFERQTKLLDLGEDLWVPYLIGALPSDVSSLIAREPEEKCRDYSHIRGMLLQRFKLTAENSGSCFHVTEKGQMGRGRIIILKSEHILKVGSMSLKLIPLTD
ncbi:uncharacterized protein TNCV_2380721 [Trichonephila clavipes]|nr:uncharacterized protein TNCV_2380721 [Trichonephila clavipes]